MCDLQQDFGLSEIFHKFHPSGEGVVLDLCNLECILMCCKDSLSMIWESDGSQSSFTEPKTRPRSSHVSDNAVTSLHKGFHPRYFSALLSSAGHQASSQLSSGGSQMDPYLGRPKCLQGSTHKFFRKHLRIRVSWISRTIINL